MGEWKKKELERIIGFVFLKKTWDSKENGYHRKKEREPIK